MSNLRKKKIKMQDFQQVNTFMKQNNKILELSDNLEKKPCNLILVSNFVKQNRETVIRLPDNKVMKYLNIRVCGLDGTMYSGEQHTLKSWEGLYLPKPIKMEVFGILTSLDSIAPFPQWILLVGEDGCIYGYEDEVLFLHANSLKDLLQNGIKMDIYYNYPNDISDEEDNVLQQDKSIKKLREVTKKFIDDDGDEFNEFLDFYF